jgi:RNA polymerase sigma factor (sigma-70 family)
MQPSPEQTLAQLYPDLHRRMVAALTAYFGFAALAEAEDLVQDTFAAALEAWRSRGVPSNPENWLFKVCKNKALNYLKKEHARHTSPYAPAQAQAYQLNQLFTVSEIEDSELRMIFACCHPRFSEKAQLILILKSLCGFSTEKAAHNLAMKPEAVRKLYYPTLQTIREEQFPLPAQYLLRHTERIENVHRTIYLLFNEGYLAYQGNQLLVDTSSLEAMRLIRLMLKHSSLCTADTHALYALFLFHSSRLSARTGPAGGLVELEHQDRSLWQQELIRLGIRHLNRSLAYRQELSRYQLEALIASLHSTAPSFPATDWKKIDLFYEQLLVLSPNPFVTLNRAIALYFSTGTPTAALAFLQNSSCLPFLQEHYLYHSFMGRINQETGNAAQAREYYSRALCLARNELEKRFFEKKLNLLLQANS